MCSKNRADHDKAGTVHIGRDHGMRAVPSPVSNPLQVIHEKLVAEKRGFRLVFPAALPQRRNRPRYGETTGHLGICGADYNLSPCPLSTSPMTVQRTSLTCCCAAARGCGQGKRNGKKTDAGARQKPGRRSSTAAPAHAVHAPTMEATAGRRRSHRPLTTSTATG